MTGALADPIMVDPDMAGDQGAALAPNDGAINIPLDKRSPESVAAALKDAAQLAGGTIKAAPAPEAGNVGARGGGGLTGAQVAAGSGATTPDCVAKLSYSNTWAASLPAELPVYPRGAVQEAAGADADGCALRVVHFLTPVGTGDVINFYYTMARKAGYNAAQRNDGGDAVLAGRKGARRYAVRVRADEDGFTEVDLVTGGR